MSPLVKQITTEKSCSTNTEKGFKPRWEEMEEMMKRKHPLLQYEDHIRTYCSLQTAFILVLTSNKINSLSVTAASDLICKTVE